MPVVIGEDGKTRRLVKKKRLVRRKKKLVIKKKKLVRLEELPNETAVGGGARAGPGAGAGPGAEGHGPGTGRGDSVGRGGSKKKSLAAVAAAAAAFGGAGAKTTAAGGGGGDDGGRADDYGDEMAVSLSGAVGTPMSTSERKEAAMAAHLAKMAKAKAAAPVFEGKPSKWTMVYLATADGKIQRRVQIHDKATGEFVLRGFADKLNLLEWEHFQLAKVTGGGPMFSRYLDAVEARLLAGDTDRAGKKKKSKGNDEGDDHFIAPVRKWTNTPDAFDDDDDDDDGVGASASASASGELPAAVAAAKSKIDRDADGSHPEIPPLPLQWIHNEVPVLDQGVEEGDILVIMVKLYTADITDVTCSQAVRLYFLDVVLKLFSETWKITLDQAVKLASLLVQIRHGSFSKSRHKSKAFLTGSLGKYMPARFISSSKKGRKAMRARILHYYREYSGMRRTIAMINYCEYATVAVGYGAAMFHVTALTHLADDDNDAGPGLDDDTMSTAPAAGSGGAAAPAAAAPVKIMAVFPEGMALYDAHSWDTSPADLAPEPEHVYTFDSDIESFVCSDGTLDVELVSGRIVSFETAPVSALDDDRDIHDVAEVDLDPMAHAEEMLAGYQHFWLLDKATTPGASKRHRTEFVVPVALASGDRREGVHVNQNTLASQVFREYSDRIGVHNAKLFGLCESTLDNDRWLDLSRPLVDQFVTKRTKLTFKMRYFFITANSIEAEQDAMTIGAIYDQIRELILQGYYLVTEDEAVQYAALSCFIENGIFERSAHSASMLLQDGMSAYIPMWLRPKRKDREWASLTFSRFRKMGDAGSDLDAQKAYIVKAMELTTFGITYFRVLSEEDDDLLLGVAAAGLVIFTATHFKKLNVFTYHNLQIDVSPAAVTLSVLVKEGEVDPLLGTAPSHWEEHVFYTETPLEAKSIRDMASVYHRVAFMKAKARARARARDLASGAF